MNTATSMAMTPGSPMSTEKVQQIQATQKTQTVQQQQTQSQQQSQTQQQQAQQQAVLMQQQAIQQQQQAIQQMQFQQQQQQQQQQQGFNNGHRVPIPPLNPYVFPAMQTIQGIQQQQIIGSDRPIMPVVSMSAQQTAQPVQQLQQTLSGTLPQGLPLQPNLAVTQQMQMGVQQIHPVSN